MDKLCHNERALRDASEDATVLEGAQSVSRYAIRSSI
jgi:hypothetical protein